MNNRILSETRLNRLRAQGYTDESDQKLSNMAFGIRFAYRLCLAVIIVAMITQSVVLFSIMAGIAFLSVLLPNHPFDYIYNHSLSKRMNKPTLPPRSPQLKFACTIATIWLTSVAYTLSAGFTTTAMVLSTLLVLVVGLLNTIDFCLPSVIYNSLFQRKETNVKV